MKELKNREIKFRIWHLEQKRFIGLNISLQSFGSWDDKCIFQQFAGINDKNEKEIYEGDILSVHLPERKKYENGEVIYSKEYLTYLIKFWAYKKMDYYSDYLCDLQNKKVEFEIIGNIYENPKLLDNNV